MHAAAANIYWAHLPRHPFLAVDLSVARHLEKKGFSVEFNEVATQKQVTDKYKKENLIAATIVESGYVAKWFLKPALDPDAVAAEWRLREAMEDDEMKRLPPQRQSTGTGEEMKTGDAIWAAILDNRYVVEIQRRFHRNYLCIFDLDGGLRNYELTTVAYGAIFGPDAGDVAAWEERAKEIADGWRTERPQK